MGLLEVQNLVKTYGQNTVLNNISFSVPDGEFFVLLGPSGGGKSTILKVLCGIEGADSGKILLGGREITNMAPRERNVGMVFQDYGLYPHMNVAENIAYGLEARGYPRDEVSKRVKDAAGRLGLTPLIDRIIVDLSGGEQQRVALARAMAKDADFYLFDEPISNLDPKLRAQARRDILMLHRLKKKPTLYVTHDQTEALAIADRIAIIARGKLQQLGTSDDLIRKPANIFIASFIGAPGMNLIYGDLAAKDGAYSVRFEGGEIELPASWKPVLRDYRNPRIVLGIPPAAFITPGMAIDGNQEGTDNQFTGVIETIEPLVSEVIVIFKHSSGKIVSAVFQGVDEMLFEPGSSMTIGLDSSQFCLFDPETENALIRTD